MDPAIQGFAIGPPKEAPTSGALRLNVHRDLTVRVQRVGAEQTPVLVIDNFVDRPHDIVELAAAGPLHSPTDMYPGIRAPAPDSYFDVLREGLTAHVNAAYGLPGFELRRATSYMCVVTTQPAELLPVQSMPHIDGTGPSSFSTVHYLCSSGYSGTSLYRHRRTGYELVPDFRHQRYLEIVEDELRTAAEPPRGYVDGGDAMFERTASMDVAFNRLVLYPSCALHSADIGEHFAFDPSPLTGRFSVNSQLQFQPRGFVPKPWF
jgi:hypothetical protein